MKAKIRRNQKLMELRRAGYSFRAIAKKLKISVNRVYQLWVRERERV